MEEILESKLRLTRELEEALYLRTRLDLSAAESPSMSEHLDMELELERQAAEMDAEETKESNPKDICGIQKAPLSTVPMNVMFELGNAMVEGAMKYGRHNYRVSGVRASVYFDAAMRHLAAWWEGEDIDRDSGLSHVTKAMACLVVVRDSMMRNNWVDDRPPASLPFMDEQNSYTRQLRDRYPNPVKPFTEI